MFAKDEKNVPFGPIVYGKNGRLEYLWRTSPLADRIIPGSKPYATSGNLVNGILRIGVPVRFIDPKAWHDVIVRFRDAQPGAVRRRRAGGRRVAARRALSVLRPVPDRRGLREGRAS